jgi:hypothetical protein
MFVVGSAGGTDTITVLGEVFVVDWTIGEVLVESLKASRKQLTQGFHQGFRVENYQIQSLVSTYIFSILDQDNTRHFSVFPNPFVSHISVKWNFEESINLLFEVFTLEGRRVFSQRRNATDSPFLIQLNNLIPATYILRISDPSRGFYESHKIVKF